MPITFEMKSRLLLYFFFAQQRPTFSEQARIGDLAQIREPQMNLRGIDLLHDRMPSVHVQWSAV
jgi:hypothetical protein